tara:strand:- start:422 stop:895 length:474 start_codon:yes stop_codon:yes gene_type:complete
MEIPGYENYTITRDGVVTSKARNTTRGGPLKVFLSAHGYKRVILTKDGKQRGWMVHQLLAKTYIENPENKPYIDHMDQNKLNNSLDNLRWATHSENMRNVNLRKDNKLKQRNITLVPAKYVVEFQINKVGEPRKRKTKTFNNLEDAIIWRDANNPLL